MLPQLNSAQNVAVPRMIGVAQPFTLLQPQEFRQRADRASTLELWLRSDSLFEFGSGGSITRWPDISGKSGLNGGVNRDATPGTAPVLTLNVANGWPAATFNGSTSNRFLAGQLGSITPAGDSETWTMYAVSRMAVASQTGCVIETAASAGSIRTGLQLGQQATTRRFNFAPSGQGTAAFFAEYTFGATTTVLHVCRFTTLPNGSPQIFEYDVSKDAKSSAITLTAQTQYRVGLFFGGTGPFNGDILEIGLYSMAISDTDVFQLASYVKTRYAL